MDYLYLIRTLLAHKTLINKNDLIINLKNKRLIYIKFELYIDFSIVKSEKIKLPNII